ncbi:MAG: NAD(+)/NADH kinase [Anaerolineae bacterium]|nr:NAD(+)/NADH kinase [Anaerolineae bacterium]MCX8067392.1 NAD(+)/NADH kinase [Anaerolineae bacterium]MDW7992003.1 NAD(+)/NADH kinase [Anaerolineae bacterium]
MASGAGRPISAIGLFRHPHHPGAAPLAEAIAAWLRKQGVRVWETDRLDPGVASEVAAVDLLVTLGGDGSILRAARLAAGHLTLILGINLGRMGFLTETEPDRWPEVLSRVLEGKYWVEERMMLRARAFREETLLAEGEALNDVVVGQGTLGRVVRLEARVDGDLLTTYVADALIIATPTGSTAYALAAGGPIMPPQQRNILLVPVAPHLSLDRAVVLAEGVQVQVVVRGHSPAAFTLDGELTAPLAPGDRVEVAASPHVARFARVRERDYFYRTLMERLVPREAGGKF